MRKLFTCIFWLIFPLCIYGQNPKLTNQYYFNPLALNPALAGSGEALSASLFYRNQWVGFQGAPKTISFSVHSPMRKQNMGLGLSVINNQIGVSEETSLIGNYSFRLKLRKGMLTMGMGGGVVLLNTAWTELLANDLDDELLLSNSPNYLIPQVSLGMQYSTGNFHFGFSLPQMLSYEFNASKDKYMVSNEIDEYTFIINTDYSLNLQQEFALIPSVMLKYQKKEKTDFIVMNRVVYKEKYSIGAAYDSEREIFRGMFQLQLNKQFRMGYASEFNAHKLSRYKVGTHEVMLRYDFRYTIKVKSPRNL